MIKMASRKNSLGREYQNGTAVSDDLRSLIVHEIEDLGGTSTGVPFGTFAKVSKKFKVSPTCVSNVWKKFQSSGVVTRKPKQGGRERKLSPDDISFIEVLKREKPSLTAEEVTNQLNQYSVFPGNTGVSKITVARAISRMMSDGPWSFKKIDRPSSDRFTPGNLRYTQAYLDYLVQNDPYRIKFFDESGFKVTVCNRTHGHSKIGERCVEVGRYQQSVNTTLNLLVGIDGVKHFNFVDGPSNTVHYVNFIHEAVESYTDDGQPALGPGDILIVDNAAIHHNDAERILAPYLHNMGITYVFLPTYSPDLSPAEPCFMKIKTVLKQKKYHELIGQNLKLSVCLAIEEVTADDLKEFYTHTECFRL